MIKLICLSLSLAIFVGGCEPSENRSSPSSVDNQIPWPEAKKLILNGEVKMVSQYHSKKVSLLLKDDHVLKTVEPNLDDIYLIVERCGAKCQEIVVKTE